ncbi:aromatic amino acid ammonia-lyase [Yinghuangia sp. ASG 101]|uniref:HAL/PAL/TAL family ammonia-lyase n=1 Tax=Yinghuangia sp. ASG 101 TaxID=2896848 RepID=UPI001E44DA8B|nr:aromatic amino acid ammonia-lyase [Yinghuangia sp. ASG 101]UGQ13393.1 aromatic amino acid ammonia-lyase [Yinghuangia sp. ASG 101]
MGVALAVALATTLVTGSAGPAPERVVVAASAAQEAGITLDGDHLTVEQMRAVLRGKAGEVRLAPEAAAGMRTARAGALAALDAGQRVYGWNQALGPLKDRPLTDAEQRDFQARVLRSHAAGTGDELPPGIARLALVLRANAMARARMGVRPEMVERMLALVNAGVTPVMPSIGSLGTGDLQPMAAAGLVLTGDAGTARLREGSVRGAREVLREAGLPVDFPLEAGEALPLISGSGVLTARYLASVDRSEQFLDEFRGAFALFMEATRAEAGSLDARTHAERRIPAEELEAALLREATHDSAWMTEEGRARFGETSPRVQDAVSVRAAPHIVATARQTLDEARTIITREANASTSNPLLFERSDQTWEFVMGGNWDGAQIGHAIDTLNAQITDVSVLSHELSGRLIASKWSYGLPDNLAGPPVGLNSGMVQVQTVGAALIPEMQARAMPAGVLSRPEKFGQEDHNTMAMASVRNLDENLRRAEVVLAVQFLLAAQGIDLARPTMGELPLAKATDDLHRRFRERVAVLGDDRWMTPDVDTAVAMVRGGALRLAGV